MDKPALRRRLFDLGCRCSGQTISYTKMLGQLHDFGNTTTLAHYLELLAGAGMLTGLSKYSGKVARSRGSSPKLQVFNTALLTAKSGLTPAEARPDAEFWGRLTESAVGRIWPTPRPRAGASYSTGARATARWTSCCVQGAWSWASRSRAAGFYRVKHAAAT